MTGARKSGLGMADIKPRLQAIAGHLARELAPGGRPNGIYYYVRSPKRAEGSMTSFVIWTGGGDKAGGFKDFVTGEAGDVFALIEYCLSNVNSPAEALAWAKQRLGLTDQSPAVVRRVKAEAKARNAEQDKADEEARERKRRNARKIWLAGEALTPKSLACLYLAEARAIPMHRLMRTRPPGAIRSHPGLAYYWDTEDVLRDRYDEEEAEFWISRRPRSGLSYHPAMVSAMSPINGGANGGLHRTWLARDGRGKAQVPTAKKMMGQVTGCAINVWRGETELSPAAAVKQGRQGPLVVTEGIEDAFSIAAVRPALRVWAVGSLSLLQTMPWPDVASELIIFADNDWKPAAVKALDDAITRLSRLGPTKVARVAGYKDANAALVAGALKF